MLWTTVGLLSGLVLHSMTIMQASSRSKRSFWMIVLCLVWMLNTLAGATVFHLIDGEFITQFAIWKPLLSTSTLVFVGLIGSFLYVNRRIPEDPIERGGLGLVVLSMLGYFAMFSIWINW